MRDRGEGVVNKGDQALAERVENLEGELEEQRMLLRHALERFETETAGRETGAQGAGRPAPEKAEKKFDPVRAIAPKWRAMTWGRVEDVPSRQEAEKTVAAKDEDNNGFGVLTEVFRLRGWEWWLNKIGIGLLLFGVVFLFKFSVDQGWLVPTVRVGMGLAIGVALVFFGLRVYEERRSFSQVILGGGIGTFYITGFAAFQLYALVPYTLVFAFMVVVTLLAFALSIRQKRAALAAIGAAGSFGTPFLLYDGSGTLGGLVIYTTLVLAGISAVHFYKGWRTLLAVSTVGVWAALLAGYAQSAHPLSGPELWSLQAGALFAALTLWLVPVVREVLCSRQPRKWPAPDPGRFARSLFGSGSPAFNGRVPAHAASVVLPITGLLFTQEIWAFSKQPLGLAMLGGTAAYAVVAAALKRSQIASLLYYTNALAALLMFTFGVSLVLKGNALYFALIAESAALHLVARRLSDKVVSAIGHALFLSLGVWISGRILFGAEEVFFFGAPNPAFLNLDTVLDVFLVAVAFGVPTIVAPRNVARAYRIFAHAAVVGLLFRELIGVAGGDNIVFLSWAVYATGLYLLSRRRPEWGTVAGSHVLWTIVGLWLAGRLVWGTDFGIEWPPVFNLRAVVDLGVISAAFLTSVVLAAPKSTLAYRIAAHVAVLALLAREFAPLPSGDAYVTIAWGVYAAGLLVLGLRCPSATLVRTGGVTLLLVVGKLFLLDLMWVGAIWRILLFLGFGGVFLVLSYHLQALWKTGSTSKPSNSP